MVSALVVHIYLVTKPVKYDNADLQLSRIDFKQTIDSVEAIKIKHFVCSLPGISNAMYNSESNNLVYGYTTGKQSPDNVFKQLMTFGNYQAERFIVTAEQMNTGCPIGKDKRTFMYMLSSTISKWFNK